MILKVILIKFNLKRVAFSVFFVAMLFIATSVCYCATLDDLLSKSSINKGDARKIQELYNNIKQFDVDDSTVMRVIGNAIRSKVETKHILRILVLISKAEVEEIPTEALMNKILEGFAKKAPPDIIIEKATAKVLGLKNAKAILNYLKLKGYETDQPKMVVNILSIYIAKGWDPSDLKREIVIKGLSHKEFNELAIFLKQK